MRHLLLASVLVLGATATSDAQTQSPFNTRPLTVTFVDSRLEDALTFLARSAGLTIEFDATLTEEVRQAPMVDSTLKMQDVTVEEALSLISTRNGLAYTVIGPKAIRISKKD